MAGRLSVWTRSLSSFPQFLHLNRLCSFLSIQYMERFCWWFKHVQLDLCCLMYICCVPSSKGVVSPIFALPN